MVYTLKNIYFQLFLICFLVFCSVKLNDEIHRIAIVFQNKNKSTGSSVNVGLSTLVSYYIENKMFNVMLRNFP